MITVISSEALITYQQVYVNNDYAAEADFERQTNIHKGPIITRLDCKPQVFLTF